LLEALGRRGRRPQGQDVLHAGDDRRAVAHGIHYQGRSSSEAGKMAWVWLRWMVRPAPDLRRWSHLDLAALIVPVDRHVAKSAVAAGVLSKIGSLGPTAADARAITAWGVGAVSDDPGEGRLRAVPVGPPAVPISASPRPTPATRRSSSSARAARWPTRGCTAANAAATNPWEHCSRTAAVARARVSARDAASLPRSAAGLSSERPR
jgi:hypothetical protein